MADQIVGSVTIIYVGPGLPAILIPDLGLLDRNIQQMQWSLAAPVGVRFRSENPIVFRQNQPGFDNWPGTNPALINNWQTTANVEKQVNTQEKYEYDIWVHHDSGDGFDERIIGFVTHHNEPIDPDMENRPQP